MRKFRYIFIVFVVLLVSLMSTGVVLAEGEVPEEPEPEQEPEEGPETDTAGPNPVVVFMAEILEMDYEEVLELKEEGLGLGNISKAHYLITLTGEGDIQSILAQAKEIGWGGVYKELGLKPGGGHGLGWMFKEYGKKEKAEHGKPEWAGGPPEHPNNNKEKVKDKE